MELQFTVPMSLISQKIVDNTIEGEKIKNTAQFGVQLLALKTQAKQDNVVGPLCQLVNASKKIVSELLVLMVHHRQVILRK